MVDNRAADDDAGAVDENVNLVRGGDGWDDVGEGGAVGEIACVDVAFATESFNGFLGIRV